MLLRLYVHTNLSLRNFLKKLRTIYKTANDIESCFLDNSLIWLVIKRFLGLIIIYYYFSINYFFGWKQMRKTVLNLLRELTNECDCVTATIFEFLVIHAFRARHCKLSIKLSREQIVKAVYAHSRRAITFKMSEFKSYEQKIVPCNDTGRALSVNFPGLFALVIFAIIYIKWVKQSFSNLVDMCMWLSFFENISWQPTIYKSTRIRKIREELYMMININNDSSHIQLNLCTFSSLSLVLK